MSATPYEEFLQRKKIDSVAWKKAWPQEWEEFYQEFSMVGEAAFDARKKFFLNNLRLQFPLSEQA